MTLDYFIQVEEGVVVEEVGVADVEEDSKIHTTNNNIITHWSCKFVFIFFPDCHV